MTPRLLQILRPIAAGSLAGLLSGGLAGGLSRVVFRVGALVAPAGLKHPYCGDEYGHVIGEISLKGIVYMVMLAGVLGVPGGLLFRAIRRWLPEGAGARSAACGLLAVALFANVVVDPMQSDFWTLGRPWLLMSLFGVVAFIYGAAIPPLLGWLEQRLPAPEQGSRAGAAVAVYALLGLMAVPQILKFFEFRPAVAIAGVLWAGYSLAGRWLEPRLRSGPVRAGGYALLAVACGLGLYRLITSVAFILGEAAKVSAG